MLHNGSPVLASHAACKWRWLVAACLHSMPHGVECMLALMDIPSVSFPHALLLLCQHQTVACCQLGLLYSIWTST